MLHRSLKRSLFPLGALFFLTPIFFALSFWGKPLVKASPSSAYDQIVRQQSGPPNLTILVDESGFVGIPVTFKATVSSSDGPVHFNWDFGDGGTASGSTVQHIYGNTGTFVVSVIATDNTGSTSESTAIEIGIIPPTVTNTPSLPMPPDVSCEGPFIEGDPIRCIASTINPVDATFRWDFGDDTPEIIGSTVSHIYDTFGEFTIAVVAMNTVGESIPTTTRIVVTPTAPKGLKINFEEPILRGYPAIFIAEITAGSNVEFSWSVSDGQIGIGGTDETGKRNTAQFILHNLGRYHVTVTAKNDSGDLTVTERFEVRPAPPFGFEIDSSGPAFPGEEIRFSARITSGDNVRILWDFGDGSTRISGERSPHTYAAAGKYPVLAVAYNDVVRMEKSIVAQVGIPLLPSLAITVPYVLVRPGFNLKNLRITSQIDPAYTYCWNFGDGTQPEVGISKEHTYEKEDSYVIEVYSTTAENACDSNDQRIEQAFAAVFVKDVLFFPLIQGGETLGLGGTATPTPTVTNTPPGTLTNTPTATTVTATPTETPTATPGTVIVPQTPTPGSVVLPPPTNP